MATEMLSEFLRVARSGDFVILDTETTGLPSAEIVQIAIINQDGDVLLDTLVKPSMLIPIEATGVHGIDDYMVEDALPWPGVLGVVANLLADRNVIIYNAVFDRAVLYSTTLAADVAAFDWWSNSVWYCAMKAFAEEYGSFDKLHKSYRWQTLSVAIGYFGRSEPQRHNALADCLDTLFVVKSMAALSLS